MDILLWSLAAAVARRGVACQQVGEEAILPPVRGVAGPPLRGRGWPGLRWLYRVAAALAALCGAVVAGAPAAAGAAGVRLTYKVSFGQVPVGESYFSWVADAAGGVWVSKEIAPGGPMARLYRVRDRFAARVRGQDGRPEWLYEYLDEPRDRRQERWSTADWQARQVAFVRVNHSARKTSRKVVSVVEGMQWPLTLPYWLSLQPLAALDGLAVPLLDGDKLKEVRLAVRGQERVQTDLGRIPCDRIDGEVWYRGEAQRAGSFAAWRRSAAPHIPVRVISRLKFGTLHETVAGERPYGELPEVPGVPVDTPQGEN